MATGFCCLCAVEAPGGGWKNSCKEGHIFQVSIFSFIQYNNTVEKGHVHGREKGWMNLWTKKPQPV